jgi:SAM-dependent methyltransferase
MDEDVPVSVDYRIAEHAQRWSKSALGPRPWRAEMFSLIATIMRAECAGRHSRVLELGSGPGFLAKEILDRLARDGISVDYIALDFSAPMHSLAKEHLGELAARVEFIERSLRDPAWSAGLGQFDVVLTNQAVHELRHKRHAPILHAQVREVLLPDGSYLVSDHWLGEGGMTNAKMYMSAQEQAETLRNSGFAMVDLVAIKGDLVLHRASLTMPDSLQ